MCLSGNADLAAGLVITAIGVDAMRHVERPRERLLAALPLVLGAHLLVEAVVWWGLDGRTVAEPMRPAATWLYLAIAFGVVPVLVPLAVGALEPVGSRWRSSVFTAIGAVVAVVLMIAIIRNPVDARIDGYHLAYRVDVPLGGLLVAAYVVATCGSFLASRQRDVRWFGVGNLVVVAVLEWIDKAALVSLWCLWAAITSLAIAAHVRGVGRRLARRATTSQVPGPARR